MSDPQEYWDQRIFEVLGGQPEEVVNKALRKPGYRRWLTREDPLMFALLYGRNTLRSPETGNQITLSEFHEALLDVAKEWMAPTTAPRQSRHIFVGPRSIGKTSWGYLLLPLWAAAHGHLRFIAAFSDSASQAEGHLATFKRELDTNARLREDFPDLCEPAVRPGGTKVSDNRQLLLTKSGFAFAAKGLDGASLGLKVGNRRPDLLLLDDVEPGESQYSAYQARQRLVTVQDVVLPLNDRAHVLWTGTVVMPGSLVHQAVRHERGEETIPWVTDDKFDVHYVPAILTNADGTERSIWPEKWPMEYLNSIRHTRSYAKNFANLPVPNESLYWTEVDIRYGVVTGITRTVLSIDPAVTAKASSDETGLAVVGFSPSEQKCLVEFAEGVRLTPGEPLRKRVLEILAMYPHITSVVVEGTQGQAMWHTVLHDLPVRLHIIQSGKASKAVRASWALQRYQQGQVLHARKLLRLEEQMVAFSGREGMADDVVDAVGQAIRGFFGDGEPAAVPLRMSVA